MPACANNCGRQVAMVGQTCPFCVFKSGPAKPVIAVPKPLGPPTLAAGTLPGGAALVLKYKRSGQATYTVVNPVNLLYILHKTAVEFKVEAINAPANLLQLVRFETAAWSGTASGASNGGSKSVTFGTRSGVNTVGGAFSLTVTFGGQAVTVNCLVYELQPTSTPADNFLNRHQDHLGVDERVTLGFTTLPANVTALEAGGLQWKTVVLPAARDTTGLLHTVGNTGLPAPTDGTAGYVAPFQVAAGNTAETTREVKLKLEVLAGPSIGLGVERAFTIQKPNAHMRVGVGNQKHTQGQPSAGFPGIIFFTPRNVSFTTLRWREGVGTLEVSGPFPAGWAGTAHGATVHGGPLHGTVTAGDATNGCRVVQTDNVYSGSFPYVAGKSNLTPVGVQTWPIDWEYTYKDLATGAWANVWIKMQRAYHKATIFENGRMVMFKGHVGCASGDCMKAEEISKLMGDPTVV